MQGLLFEARRVKHERTKPGSGLCERAIRREATETETEGFVINEFPIVHVCIYVCVCV